VVKGVEKAGSKRGESGEIGVGGGGYVHLMRALGVALKRVNSLIAKCKTIKRLQREKRRETLKREKENVLGETVWFLDKANNITRGRESGR